MSDNSNESANRLYWTGSLKRSIRANRFVQMNRHRSSSRAAKTSEEEKDMQIYLGQVLNNAQLWRVKCFAKGSLCWIVSCNRFLICSLICSNMNMLKTAPSFVREDQMRSLVFFTNVFFYSSICLLAFSQSMFWQTKPN